MIDIEDVNTVIFQKKTQKKNQIKLDIWTS